MRLPRHRAHPDTPTAAHPPAAVDAGPATRKPGDGPPAGDLDQRRRNTAAVAAYGRLLTGAHAPENLTADPTGVVHVCGIGLIPSPSHWPPSPSTTPATACFWTPPTRAPATTNN